jgi:hypothetical protein
VYEDKMKLKGEKRSKKKYQPCKDVRRSKTKVSQERRRLDSAKIEINRDSAEREEKKKREKKGRARKEEGVEKKTC